MNSEFQTLIFNHKWPIHRGSLIRKIMHKWKAVSSSDYKDEAGIEMSHLGKSLDFDKTIIDSVNKCKYGYRKESFKDLEIVQNFFLEKSEKLIALADFYLERVMDLSFRVGTEKITDYQDSFLYELGEIINDNVPLISELDLDTQMGVGCYGAVWSGTLYANEVTLDSESKEKIYNQVSIGTVAVKVTENFEGFLHEFLALLLLSRDQKRSRSFISALITIVLPYQFNSKETDLGEIDQGILSKNNSVIKGYRPKLPLLVFELFDSSLYLFSHTKFGRQNIDRKELEDFVRDIIRHLLQSIKYIHSHGILHLDLKPENVLIKYNEKKTMISRVVIGDFGISRRITDKPKHFNVVTCAYRAPEVVLELFYDKKTDIYSIGWILADLWRGMDELLYKDIKKQIRNMDSEWYWIMSRWITISDGENYIPYLKPPYRQCYQTKYIFLEAYEEHIKKFEAHFKPWTGLISKSMSSVPLMDQAFRSMIEPCPGYRLYVDELLELPWFSTNRIRMASRMFKKFKYTMQGRSRLLPYTKREYTRDRLFITRRKYF